MDHVKLCKVRESTHQLSCVELHSTNVKANILAKATKNLAKVHIHGLEHDNKMPAVDKVVQVANAMRTALRVGLSDALQQLQFTHSCLEHDILVANHLESNFRVIVGTVIGAQHSAEHTTTLQPKHAIAVSHQLSNLVQVIALGIIEGIDCLAARAWKVRRLRTYGQIPRKHVKHIRNRSTSLLRTLSHGRDRSSRAARGRPNGATGPGLSLMLRLLDGHVVCSTQSTCSEPLCRWCTVRRTRSTHHRRRSGLRRRTQRRHRNRARGRSNACRSKRSSWWRRLILLRRWQFSRGWQRQFLTKCGLRWPHRNLRDFSSRNSRSGGTAPPTSCVLLHNSQATLSAFLDCTGLQLLSAKAVLALPVFTFAHCTRSLVQP